MKKMLRKAWLISFYFMFFFQALTWAASSQPSFFDFRAGQFSVFQKGGTSFAGYFAWSPWIGVNSSLGLRLEASAGLAKGASTGTDTDFFVIGGGKGMISFLIADGLFFETGPGYQKWLGAGDIGVLTATAGIAKNFSGSKILIFSGFVADYTAAFVTNNLSHEVQLGLMF